MNRLKGFGNLVSKFVSMKEKIKKCLCRIPYCAKCLGSNCQDDNCKIHTISEKIRVKKYFLSNVKDKNKKQEQIAEIKRLENSLLNKIK